MNQPEISAYQTRRVAAELAERLGPEPSLEEIFQRILDETGEQPPLRILRFPELKVRKGIDYTRQYVDRLERKGRFPTRIQLGPNSVGWLEEEVDAWIRSMPRGRIRDARVERGQVRLKRGGAKLDRSEA